MFTSLTCSLGLFKLCSNNICNFFCFANKKTIVYSIVKCFLFLTNLPPPHYPPQMEWEKIACFKIDNHNKKTRIFINNS